MSAPDAARPERRPPDAGPMRGARRGVSAWRALAPEQRLAGVAAAALLLTMFLPWYSETFTARVTVEGRAVLAHDDQSAIGAFSWVEAAVLLVALTVLALLFARGERRAFHLPGGDGAVITAAGAWAALLVVWRFFDKPELGKGVSVGLQWGIFVALGAAIALAIAGNRIRAAHRPEPPLQAAEPPPAPGAPLAVHIPEERPHLAETGVMPRPARGGGATSPTSPLSREAAARDTAEFGAVPRPPEPAPAEPAPEPAPEGRPSEEETRPMRPDGGDGEGQPPLPGMPH